MPQQDDKGKAKLEIELISKDKSSDKAKKSKPKSEPKSKEQKGADAAEAVKDPMDDPVAAMFAPKPDYASMGEQSLFGSISPVGQGGAQTQMQQQEQAMMQQAQQKPQKKNSGQAKTARARDIVVQGIMNKLAEATISQSGSIAGYKGRPAHHYLGDLGPGKKTTYIADKAHNQAAVGLNKLLMSLAHFFAAKSHLPKVKSPRSDAR